MLRFEFEPGQIEKLTAELQLTPRQAKAALNRALRRTAGTMRKRAERELKSELDIRKVAFLRRRLKEVRLTRKGFEGIKLWFGENDMAVSALRGRIKDSGAGAEFAGKVGRRTFKNGFVRRGKYGRTIFQREGSKRLPINEAKMPVQAQMDNIIEWDLFSDVLEVLWKNFERDMLARAKFLVGRQ